MTFCCDESNSRLLTQLGITTAGFLSTPIPRPRLSATRVSPRYQPAAAMISDTELYQLAIFLGSAAMVLIILYHFFEVNSGEEQSDALKEKVSRKGAPQNTPGSTKTR